MGASLGLNHGSFIYEKKKKIRKKILVTLQTVLLRNAVFWFLWRPSIMRITASKYFFSMKFVSRGHYSTHNPIYCNLFFFVPEIDHASNLLGYD